MKGTLIYTSYEWNIRFRYFDLEGKRAECDNINGTINRKIGKQLFNIDGINNRNIGNRSLLSMVSEKLEIGLHYRW